jgi:hypothetical protein
VKSVLEVDPQEGGSVCLGVAHAVAGIVCTDGDVIMRWVQAGPLDNLHRATLWQDAPGKDIV